MRESQALTRVIAILRVGCWACPSMNRIQRLEEILIVEYQLSTITDLVNFLVWDRVLLLMKTMQAFYPTFQTPWRRPD